MEQTHLSCRLNFVTFIAHTTLRCSDKYDSTAVMSYPVQITALLPLALARCQFVGKSSQSDTRVLLLLQYYVVPVVELSRP